MNFSEMNALSGAAQTNKKPIFPVLRGEKPSTETLKVFVKNIADGIPDSLLESLLGEFGALRSFRRARNERDEPVAFAIAEFAAPESIIACCRLFNGFKLCGRVIEVVLNQQAKGFLAEFVEALRAQIAAESAQLSADALDAAVAARLAERDAATLGRLALLVDGFERNRAAIVKEEPKSGHRLYTEEKLNTHKEKYGLSNARELEELFIKELKAWTEADAQYRARRERERAAERELPQRKPRLLAETLAAGRRGYPPRSSARLATLAKDLKVYGMKDIAEFLGCETFIDTKDKEEGEVDGEAAASSSDKRPKIESVAVQPVGAIFTRVELAAGNPPPERRFLPNAIPQKAITAPELLRALPSAALFNSPAVAAILQTKLALERAKAELLGDGAKLRALVELRRAIPKKPRDLFRAPIDWARLEEVLLKAKRFGKESAAVATAEIGRTYAGTRRLVC